MPETPLSRPEISPSTPELRQGDTVEFSPERTAKLSVDVTESTLPTIKPIPAPSSGPAPLAPVTAPLQKHVEEVMSAGLADSYAQMDPATQAKFRTVGEETAGKISTLLQSSKVQVKKIVELLVTWLRIIPGVNRFFLEQEAKIKADKILALKSRE